MTTIKGGYVGRLVYVDLSEGTARAVSPSSDFMLSYVGGRGWGARIIWDEIPANIDPLGPRNKLCIITGPLTGTFALGSGRTSFSAISPGTGYYGDSNMGGTFGVKLKQAGFDGVVVEGISEKPVYLWIRDGEVDIRGAEDYWGKGSLETERMMKGDLGKTMSAVTIGPAGENMVRFACITGDYGRQAARCGLGAVMGSKRLKAVVASGTSDIPVADITTLWKLFKDSMEFLSKSVDIDFWRRMGTWQFTEWSNENECLPTENFSKTICEPYSQIGDVLGRGAKTADTTCFMCPVGAGNLCRIERGGRKAALIGPEYETAAMIGSNCGIGDMKDVAYAAYLCDELGLDSVSAGVVASYAMECRERGILTKEDLGGLDLSFGNSEALFSFLGMLARREGIGDLFAEGVKRASNVIGKGSERFAMHVKGLEITAYDQRAAPAMSLSFATCDIGAHHNRSWAIIDDIEMGRKRYDEAKAERVIFLQHLRPLYDCLGICRFMWIEFHVDVENYVRAYTAATGVDTSLEKLLNSMEVVWNLTRCIGVRNGMRGREDWLPARSFEDPVPGGQFKGATLDEDSFRGLVRLYYKLRGWTESGVPTRQKLEELGLGDIADELGVS